MAGNTIMTAKNSFSEGLIMDFAPDNTQANCLTSALNATLLTFNGNEMSLLNDMGNGRVETAYLPDGYVPVGTCEFGDIIYIVSYNPIIDKALIGCFPSPERNISSEELGQNPIQVSASEFQLILNGDITGKLKTSSVRKIIFNNDMHPGDLYIIYSEAINAEDSKSWGKYISDYGNTDLLQGGFPKLLKISIVSVEDSGKITYLDSNVKWYNNNYYILDNIAKTSEDKLDIDSYRTMTSSAYSTFASKVSGKLALLIELEKITGFSCTWDCYLPREIVYTPWVYTGKDELLSISEGEKPSTFWKTYGSSDLIWTTGDAGTGDSLYIVNHSETLNGIIPNKGISGTIINKYNKGERYSKEIERTILVLNTSELTIQTYLKGTTVKLGTGALAVDVVLETSYLVLSQYNSRRIYVKTDLSTECNYSRGTGIGDLYLPFYFDGRNEYWDYDASITDEEQFLKKLTYYYEIYNTTNFTFNDSTYLSISDEIDIYTNRVSGCWKVNGYDGTPINNFEIKVNKSINITPKYDYIINNNKCYIKTDYTLEKEAINRKKLENNTDLLIRSTPIYLNFNWTTDNKNINPKYAILDSSNWIKNLGKFNYYNSDLTTNTKYISEYNTINIYNHKYNTGTWWTFTRGYLPENNITYNEFVNKYNYETYANNYIEKLLKVRDEQVFSSIKTITKSINSETNLPEEGYYYINAIDYELKETGSFRSESYKAIKELDKGKLVETPVKIDSPKLQINDDIINNTFKYPITKRFTTFEIPIQQEIDGTIIDVDTSNFVYEYTITPAMPYGKLEEFSVTGTIDFSKIGTTDIKLKKWKYHNYDDKLTLTWGMDAYTEPDKGIPEVVFEFYDNQGLAAAYHIQNYSSYNGLFTNYLNLNGLNGTPGLNNIDWKGNEFFHLKNEIKREEATSDNTYYYLENGKYIKVSNLDKLDKSITTLYESDSGVLYSNWLYGVKIIVRYEYKNAIGEYLKNEEPITEYRWLWTNDLFNEYYYTTDDFTELQFSLNLDMDVNYSIIEDNWNLQQNTYQHPNVQESKLSTNQLRGAIIQHINCDRSKDNVNLKITPGLIDTHNTFTLCSEMNSGKNKINPLKNIHAEIILADLQMLNYPEQPSIKQYTSGIEESEQYELTPSIATNLTGIPEYRGPNLSRIVGLQQSSIDSLDIYDDNADSDNFKNNFSLYNESYINKELYKMLNVNIGLSEIGFPMEYSTFASNVTQFTPTFNAIIDNSIVFDPTINNMYGDFVLERYFKVKEKITNFDTYKTAINTEMKDVSIQSDINTFSYNVTVEGNTIELTKNSFTDTENYMYKIGRSYTVSNTGTIEPVKTDGPYDIDITLVASPVTNTETSFETKSLYCYSHDETTWIERDTSADSPIENLSQYKYKWLYDKIYTLRNEDADKTDGTYVIVDNKYILHTVTLSGIAMIHNDIEYNRNEILFSENGIIVPKSVKINPNYLYSIYDESSYYELNPISLNKDIDYCFLISDNLDLYYLTEEEYNDAKINDDYNNYYKSNLNLPGSVAWTKLLKIINHNDILKFVEDTNIYLIVKGKNGNSGSVSIYLKKQSFVENKLSYLDSDGNLKEVNNYYSYKFESELDNLHSLMNEGINLALSGIHFSKYKLQTTPSGTQKVKIVRPYVYHEKDLLENNLKLLTSGEVSFENMLFFSMDNRSGEDTRLMGTIHKIKEYNGDNLKMERTTNLSSLESGSGDVNLKYSNIDKWADSLWTNKLRNFYPVGWGTLSDEDGTQVLSFKRGNVTISLTGMAAKEHSSVSSIATLGTFLKGNTNKLLFSDNWIKKGALNHAKNVLAFLTQVYYLDTQEVTEDSAIQEITNYAYLSDNYTIYSRDIIVKLDKSILVKNCNLMITLRGLNYEEYIKSIVENKEFNKDINLSNVTCNLDSVMKVVPIGFKFNYIMPKIDSNNANQTSGQYYRLYKVNLDGNKPYEIVTGQDLEYNTPYMLSNAGVLEKAYGYKTILHFNNANISVISPSTNALKEGEKRLYVTSLGSAISVNTINKNLQHYNDDTSVPILTITAGLDSVKDWNWHSTYDGKKKSGNELYIVGFPGKYSAGALKYFG